MIAGLLGTLAGPLLKPLIGEAFSAVREILNRVLPPEKMSEKERKEFEQEMDKLKLTYENRVDERVAESEKLFETRVTAEYNKPMWFRDMVRPVITMGWFGFYAWLKYKVITVVLMDGFQYPGDLEAIFSGYDAAIGLTITGFWFGGKFLERTLKNKNILKNFFKI